MTRSTGWRIVKRVLDQAGIEGRQATAKGGCRGFGAAMIMGGMEIRPLMQ